MPVLPIAPHEHADLIPIRMCGELVYCPRLFHLEHVQGIFVESHDTVAGRSEHERAARRGRVKRLPVPTAEPPPWGELPRRLQLQSEAWGVRGEVDLLEIDGEDVVAVEAKHGAAPRGDNHRFGDHALPYRIWPGDVAQLGLYMALLREAGLPCSEGRVWYRRDKVGVHLPWSHDLELFLREVVAQARSTARLPVAPDPLADSPKCPGCSLHGVCLPDEHHALQRQAATPASGEVRRIVPGRDERAVLHVVTPGSLVRRDSDTVVVAVRNGGEERVPMKDLAHVAVFGPSQITAQCLTRLVEEGIGISHHSSGGRLLAYTAAVASRNVGLRRAQYRGADDPTTCREVARALVIAKIHNQRTVLKRWRRGAAATMEADAGTALPDWAEAPDPGAAADQLDARRATVGALRRMLHAERAAARADDVAVIRGHEGDAAAAYFAALPAVLPPAWRADLCGRTRRPPRDRVNAMLGFGYALLCRDAVAACVEVGLDPMLGFLHTLLAGRPALALDLMEPFRPAWVDTAVLRLLATGGVGRDDFHVSSLGVMLSDAGRRALVGAYERRADELTTHPRFGYRMSYRRLLELEARVLGKVLAGELDAYTPLWTR